MYSEIRADEFKLAESIANTLIPVKLAVDALCRRDCTLISAEGALLFLFEQLSKQNTMISMKMLETLKTRLSLRHTKVPVSLLMYLHNPA